MRTKVVTLLLFAMTLMALNPAFADADTDWAPYASVLKKYVSNSGKVDYKGLKTRAEELKKFNASLDTARPGASDNEKIAFYINVYNAFTLQAVIEKYPVKSIKDIPNIWDEKRWKLGGKTVSLNDIEHEILRKQFNEPRIHMGLVCASVGCPGLQNIPFTGDKLIEQLNKQTEKYLSHKDNFHFDGDTVYLSQIFEWFGQDFVKNYGNAKSFSEYDNPGRAVLNFIQDHIPPQQMDKLLSTQWKIKFTSYNWALNEK